MASRKSEVHHIVPRCLLSLHEKANGTELDGEGIQAWLEWEMEAFRWRVPKDISRSDLEELVDRSSAESESCAECLGCRSTRTSLNPMQIISKGEERA